MRLDLIIRGGTVATASDVFQCDVGIRDGVVAAMADRLDIAAEIVDATGLYVLPGGIDSHVHVSQPSSDGAVMADDFDSATLSAAFGGNTTILPFCLQEKGVSLRQAVKAYHALAEGECHIDVAFHMIVTDPTPQVLGQELPSLIAEGYRSIKVFMTYDSLRLRDDQILATLDCARRSRAVVMVHCENEDAIRFLIGRHEEKGEVAPKYHATSRPVAAEREATHRALSFAEIVGTRIVIVHVSNRQAMEEIEAARRRGVAVTGETCPQYLLLTAEDLDLEGLDGAKLVCSPPPRDRESQVACWEGLQNGAFELFSSDHCPYRFEDPLGKLSDRGRRSFKWVPNGIPGVETRLPLLFSEGVNKGRIDINRFVALSSTNHAKQYGLYPRKGTIAIGSDADIVLWDPDKLVTIRNADLHHGADYTPYEGRVVQGWPVRVLLRGKTIVAGSDYVGMKGAGQYLARV